MKNLYLYQYTYGTCGDFICLEVSKDENFYSNALIRKTNINRYLAENPLARFGLDYKEGVTVISPALYREIDETYKDYNLIIPAHMMNRRLPRVKLIKSYVEDTKYIPLFFMMVWLKSLVTKRDLTDQEDILSPLGNLHTAHTQYRTFKERWNGSSFQPAVDLINCIEGRGYYYNFELRALEFNRFHITDFVKGYYSIYENRLMQYFPSDIRIAVDQLVTNPKKHVVEFSKQIDMARPLNVERIEEYHRANLHVIENIFNKPYEELIQGNWQDEFQEYVNQICPDNWFNRTNQQP